MGKDEITVGFAKVTRESDEKTSSHASIKATSSRPVRYNKKIRKKAESIGMPKRLQRALVPEQFVNRCKSVG
jgi:hypothetical protein